MGERRQIHREVQRRIDYIGQRLVTETRASTRVSMSQERTALTKLLERSDLVQGLLIAMRLIRKAAETGDTETIKRVADEALERETA